jgi:hypothetical protein
MNKKKSEFEREYTSGPMMLQSGENCELKETICGCVYEINVFTHSKKRLKKCPRCSARDLEIELKCKSAGLLRDKP